MPLEIVMPSLAAGMTEGTLTRWLKGEGDAVAKGEAIAEVETDKATLEMEAEETGLLGRILVPAGPGAVAVNTPLAVLFKAGEAVDTAAPAASPAPTPAPAPATLPSASPPAALGGTAPGHRVPASPLARRLAAQYGVSLTGLHGSGPSGRVVRLDVERLRDAAAARPAAAPALPPAVAAPALPSPVEAATVPAVRPQAAVTPSAPQPMPWQAHTAIPNSAMRKTIARRLSEAKQTVPHFYLTVEVELDAVLSLRQRLNGRSGAESKLSVNDFIVKAAALALRRVPAANAMWTDEAILRFAEVDISVAVATDGGLITPVVRQADRKGLATISGEVKQLAAKARDGKLTPEEYQGGSFTISNLGMYGITQFSAIVNPPQACILAVGAGEPRPVVRDGTVQVRTLMTCTLSVDHRAVDGAVGAEFLAAFKPLIEDPLQLML